MKNYTEELKKHWKIDNLTFIPAFNKVDEKHGYFVSFINLISRKKLDYHVFDVVEFWISVFHFYMGITQNCAVGRIIRLNQSIQIIQRERIIPIL
jgi:hypothetical protein